MAEPKMPASLAKTAPRTPRTTRQPSGLPSWPVILIAGAHKTGKTHLSAEASASNLIDRTFWIGYGEKDPDEFAALPGARFELIDHDGTTDDVRAAIYDIAADTAGDKTPHLLVIDSISKVWDTLRDKATALAEAKGTYSPNGELTIGRDVWNRVNGEWFALLAAVRAWNGPVILTARIDEVQATDGGRVIMQTIDRIQGHHSLPFDVDGVVELESVGHAKITGLRSTVLDFTGTDYTSFSFDLLWRTMGLTAIKPVRATYAEPVIRID